VRLGQKIEPNPAIFKIAFFSGCQYAVFTKL
jgi:hypothetical protein